jgi:phenylalanine-4-hydroxylase
MESSAAARARAERGNQQIPEEFRRYLVDQDYGRYGQSAQEVWREVLSRNAALTAEYGKWVPDVYREGMRALELPERIPRLEELNERLQPTGWRTVCVNGYVPTSAYVGLMSMNIFPVSRLIRRPEHIDFAPAPDLVHDVLGHLPLLFSADHREFLRRLARVMAKAVPNSLDQEFFEANTQLARLKEEPSLPQEARPELERRVRAVNGELVSNASEVTHVRRMYIWSVEFGLIGDVHEFTIHGAGLLSAPLEFKAVCEGAASIMPYSLDVVQYENAFSDLLEQYFVAPDFACLHDVLDGYETRMQYGDPALRASEIRGILPTTAERKRNHA